MRPQEALFAVIVPTRVIEPPIPGLQMPIATLIVRHIPTPIFDQNAHFLTSQVIPITIYGSIRAPRTLQLEEQLIAACTITSRIFG